MILDLSGVTVVVSGLPDRIAERLRGSWAPFLRRDVADVPIEVAVTAPEARDDDAPFGAKRVRATVEGERAQFTIPEGTVVVGPSGPIAIDLAATTTGKQSFAVVNLVLAALAWRLPQLGGALLHAAGIVLDGRAFLLVGAEGAGKSTWTELAGRAGAGVLSDDVVLVLEGPSGFDAIASPFRAPMDRPVLVGRWPVGGILGASHAATARLHEEPPMIVRARLAANMPYAVEGLGGHPAVGRVLDRLAAAVPHRRLAFAPDPSFISLLRSFRGA
jgi:hypothetical protein